MLAPGFQLQTFGLLFLPMATSLARFALRSCARHGCVGRCRRTVANFCLADLRSFVDSAQPSNPAFATGHVGEATSKRQQEEHGKNIMKGTYESSANSLHALLRLMARDDIKYSTLMLGLATGPWARLSARMQKELKSAAETSRLQTAKECISTGCCWSELSRCGFAMASKVPQKLPESERGPLFRPILARWSSLCPRCW